MAEQEPEFLNGAGERISGGCHGDLSSFCAYRRFCRFCVRIGVMGWREVGVGVGVGLT